MKIWPVDGSDSHFVISREVKTRGASAAIKGAANVDKKMDRAASHGTTDPNTAAPKATMRGPNKSKKWPDDFLDKIVEGDCLETLKKLPAESIQTCVTSPPYWGLRDYGTAKWEGGDSACNHSYARGGQGEKSTKQTTSTGTQKYQYQGKCKKCGATRKDEQLGLEKTPEQFVSNIVSVFREVRRVLRDDGTLWLNFGDSYVGPKGGFQGLHGQCADRLAAMKNIRAGLPSKISCGFKPKNLVGIPWRVAFALQGFAVVPFESFSVWADELKIAREVQDWEAVEIVEGKLRQVDSLMALQADGWYLRSDIIWSKPNPMPESITDRPTKAHEYVFLLSKSEKYFYDSDAIRETAIHEGLVKKASDPSKAKNAQKGKFGRTAEGFSKHDTAISGRNKRTVWTVPTLSYAEAHFATFPPKLIEPCILAGTSERGACGKCGAPWLRESKVKYENPGNRSTNGPRSEERKHIKFGTAGFKKRLERRSETVGWRPSCTCGEQSTKPCVVLDPFMGAGTTALIAAKHSRRFVGLELSPEYAEIARKRIKNEVDQGKFL